MHMCVCVRVFSCQHDKEMRGDRHNSCIMIVTSEPYLSDLWFIYASYLVLRWRCFLPTDICIARGNADGWKRKYQRPNIWTFVCVLGSWTVWKQKCVILSQLNMQEKPVYNHLKICFFFPIFLKSILLNQHQLSWCQISMEFKYV